MVGKTDKLNAFRHRAVDDKLGLSRAMGNANPVMSGELATERYVHE